MTWYSKLRVPPVPGDLSRYGSRLVEHVVASERAVVLLQFSPGYSSSDPRRMVAEMASRIAETIRRGGPAEGLRHGLEFLEQRARSMLASEQGTLEFMLVNVVESGPLKVDVVRVGANAMFVHGLGRWRRMSSSHALAAMVRQGKMAKPKPPPGDPRRGELLDESLSVFNSTAPDAFEWGSVTLRAEEVLVVLGAGAVPFRAEARPDFSDAEFSASDMGWRHGIPARGAAIADSVSSADLAPFRLDDDC